MSIANIGAAVVGGLLGRSGSRSDGEQQTVQQQNTTQQTIPWEALQPYLRDLYARSAELMGQAPPTMAETAPVPSYYPYATTSAYDPAEQTLQGLQGALNFASNYIPQMTDAGLGSLYSMMGAADVANNPYVRSMQQATARDLTRSGLQQIGELDQSLGNRLQDFGLASRQAANRFGQTSQFATEDLGRELTNANQNFGLGAQQAADQFGLQSQFTTEDLARTLGNANQDFGLAARQATGDQQRLLQGLLGDFRSNYQETASDLQRQLMRDILPEIRAGAGLSGGYGGTRQGVAEGVALGDLAEALSDYGRGFDTQFEQALSSGAGTLRDTLSNLGRDVSQSGQAGAMGTSQALRGLGQSTSNLVANLGRDVSQAQQAGALGTSQAIRGLGQSTADVTSNLGRDYSQAQQAGARSVGNTVSNLGDALGNALAQTGLGAYGQGLQAQTQATQMLPSMAGLGLTAPETYVRTGGALDALRDQQIAADMARWNYAQGAGRESFLDTENRAMQNYQNQWIPLANANSILSGTPYQNQSTTQATTQPSNPWAGALGGALTGWQIGQQLFNGGSSYNPAYGRPAGLFTPEIMGEGQYGPPAPSLLQQWF